ncbi:SGNH/GDSL hydrolase family protein [Rhizobium hidalgonense]|uniref:SGNH/GDSL hydrolase family protein n=1 Tax=Rhizobium hidalgonense TaxID=1538159 RepID=UPI00287258AF|nr:SGNH/GDSL hydrolase family protein [Rhizobium hidalgonense]MDR9813119.1 SGNH/GDSL hydrolase family protein [Rhizobium hidalgonense]
MKLISLVFSLFLLASQALAQVAPPDALFERIAANRDGFGQVVFLFGDSFMRGYALGFFPDQATEEQKQRADWSLRSPAAMLEAKGYVAAYSSFIGQPDNAVAAAARIKDLVKRRIIRGGDVVVMEDAGLHDGNPISYFDNWLLVGRELQKSGAVMVMMTIPDNITVPTLGGQPSDQFRYSVDFGGVSHNDATVFAAHLLGAKLIDFKAAVENVQKSGRIALREDGIHPNIEGQQLLVDAIVQAIQGCTGPCTEKSAMR